MNCEYKYNCFYIYSWNPWTLLTKQTLKLVLFLALCLLFSHFVNDPLIFPFHLDQNNLEEYK